jgi:drug/metabolite transporter (DMT)-like permease
VSPRSGRLLLVVAAVLWSTSSIFIRVLQKPTAFQLQDPGLSPLQIAFFRSVFAGLAVLAFVKRSRYRFNTTMLGMLVAFGIMTTLYLSALGLGSAANAILLQNTAPVWVYFLGVLLLGQASDSRTRNVVLLAAVGALVIVFGNWPRHLPPQEQSIQIQILLMAAGSGFFYAIVVLLLSHLKEQSSLWLATLNLLGGSAIIAVFGYFEAPDFLHWLCQPTWQQLLFIAVYGIVQLAVPYVLFARSLKTVTPQEAGIITLIEPLLNPVWAYLLWPETETPTGWTLFGGAILLLALLLRYK